MTNSEILFFDTHAFEKPFYLNSSLKFQFYDFKLNEFTVASLPSAKVVCCFVNDRVNAKVLDALKSKGVQLVALRCAGFNNVDMDHANQIGIKVVRVPEYSPHSVAEHAVGLMLTLVRKIHKSYHRVHDMNFSLDGLVGFDIYNKNVGVIGTGRIGKVFGQILSGFGAHVSAYDPKPDMAWASRYKVKMCSLAEIWASSDIISLHCPLTPESQHLINEKVINTLKPGCLIINTSRGGLIDTTALIQGLKSKKISAAGLDVYEEEENLFFKDLSGSIMDDDKLARLITFPNVIITSHQGFLTNEALKNIADTTVKNISEFMKIVSIL